MKPHRPRRNVAASRALGPIRAYAVRARAAGVKHVAYRMSRCGRADSSGPPTADQAASASRSVEGLSPKVSRISLSSTRNGRSDM